MCEGRLMESQTGFQAGQKSQIKELIYFTECEMG